MTEITAPKSGVMRVVGFSGGADSQGVALWVRERFPAEEIILLNGNAGGNEHPITEEHIREYSETVFPVVTVTALVKDMGTRGTRKGGTKDRREEFDEDAPLTFEMLAYIKDLFPARKMQFCTEHLKLAPQRRWMAENLIAKGIDFERYIGVRRDESTDRAESLDGLGSEPRLFDTFFDCYLNYPLADWPKGQVFDYLRTAGEPINPLYTMGFSRVGCAPCVNSNKEDVRLWAARFPQMIDKVREWEKRTNRTFFRQRNRAGRLMWVDEVVSWSRTSHGGKQFNLPMVEAEAKLMTCSSKYGLCE